MPATIDQAGDLTIRKARSRLVMHHPFWGQGALHLHPTQSNDPTLYMATDGTNLYYNPIWVARFKLAVNATIVGHEVCHCVLGHVWRKSSRIHALWNIACDHVVNLILKDAGMEFPPEKEWAVYADPRFAGMSAERVYAILHDEAEKNGTLGRYQDGTVVFVPDLMAPADGASQDGDADGQGSGEGRALTAADWAIIAESAAMVCRKAGTLPGSLDRAITASREPIVDWAAELREFVQHTIPSDYSWINPDRRHLWLGTYLPGTQNENAAEGVVFVDTSGSITKEMLEQAAGEFTSILQEYRPSKLTVVYCDAAVNGEPAVFTPDDGQVTLEARGGGGTAFKPAFDWVAEHMPTPPAFAVYFTDLYGSDNHLITDPGYPVLWATTYKSDQQAPFGRVVRCEVDG